MTDTPHRVLLLEFVNADQFPGRVSTLFPLLSGYLHAVGVPSRWVRFAVPTTNFLEHLRDEITLTPAELAGLLGVVDELQPTLLIGTDPLFSAQAADVRRHAPGVDFVAEKAFGGLAGARPFDGTRELDQPDFWPRHVWEPGNERASLREHDNIYLRCAERCGHGRLVSSTAVYAGATDPRVTRHRGCAFCRTWVTGYAGPGDPDLRLGRPTPLAWVAKQIEAVARDRSATGRLPHALLLETLSRAELLQQCLESMAEHGLAPDVQLLIAVRCSQVPFVESVLREHFARSPTAGVRLGAYATGIESFAARDLELFTKGTTPRDGLRAVNALRALAEEFPARFSYTGLSFILLSPWTTAATLHLNLGLIRRLGLTRREAGNLFQSRLRLHPELPITWLAEREGLLVDEEPDPVVVMNRRKLFDGERPWRFADPRLRPLSRLMMRFDLFETPLRDALTERIEQRFRAVDPDWSPGRDDDLLDLLQSAVEVVGVEPAVLDTGALLEQAFTLLESRWRAAAAPPARRFRIGERRLDLEELVGALAGLVEAGVRPVLAVGELHEADRLPPVFDSLRRRGLPHGLAPPPATTPWARGTLLVARTEALLARALAAHEALGRAGAAAAIGEAVREIDALRGIPPCCAGAHADGPWAGLPTPAWAALAWRASLDGEVPAVLNPLLAPSASFVPCGPGCGAALEQYRAMFALLGAAGHPVAADGRPYLFSLAGPGDGDLVGLRIVAAAPGRLRYDPAAILPGDDGLRAALRAGDCLELDPAQLRVVAGTTPLATLSATHWIWSATSTWHAAEWLEVARGVAWIERRRRLGLDPAWSATAGRRLVASRVRGAAEARPAGPPRLAGRVGAALARVGATYRKRTGYVIETVTGDEAGVQVVLRRGDVVLRLVVQRVAEARRAFRRGRRLAVSHDVATQVDTAEKSAAVTLLHELLERALAGASARRARGAER
jgi:hypothetical protein